MFCVLLLSLNSCIFRDRLSASDMMIVRKVIEYIYERYVLNEQQQQQQQQQQNFSDDNRLEMDQVKESCFIK